MINQIFRRALILSVISALIFSFLFMTACKKEKSVFAVAEFSFSGNAAATLPVTVQFTNSSIGLSYTWDFGDGSSSVEDNPRHIYNQYGIYRVKLTARGTNNIDSLIVDVVIGGTLGQITVLNCASAQVNRTIKTGDVLNQHPVLVPYTGSNGGVYNGQSIASTGVTGLTATLTAGNLSWGAGNLEYKLTGTPQSFGQAKFNLSIGGRTCELNLTVVDSGDYIPRNGLIGWWPFNGNANDESGNGNNGIVAGATLTTDRFGIPNKAYSFNGVSDFIKVNNSNNLESSNLSISFWLRSTSIQSQHIFYKVIPNTAFNETYSVALNLTQAGTLNFDIKNNNCNPGQGWQSLSVIIGSPTNWSFFVLTHDGQSRKIFRNGQLLNTSIAPFPISSCPGGDLLIGCDWQFNNKLAGQLDDIGIWNRALNQLEIQALYLGGQ